jgi:hypothetical protein
MTDTEQLAQPAFKVYNTGPPVGQPTMVHDLAHPLQKTLFVADVRTADVQLLVEALLAAEDGEIIYAFLCEHVNAASPISET